MGSWWVLYSLPERWFHGITIIDMALCRLISRRSHGPQDSCHCPAFISFTPFARYVKVSLNSLHSHLLIKHEYPVWRCFSVSSAPIDRPQWGSHYSQLLLISYSHRWLFSDLFAINDISGRFLEWHMDLPTLKWSRCVSNLQHWSSSSAPHTLS